MSFSSRQQLAIGLTVLIGLAGSIWSIPLVAAHQARSPLYAVGPDRLAGWAGSSRLDQPITCAAADANGDGVVNIADVAFVGLRTGESQALDMSAVALIGVCYGVPTELAVPLMSQQPASAPLPITVLNGQALVTDAASAQSVDVSVDATVATGYYLYLPIIERSAPATGTVTSGSAYGDTSSREARALLQWFAVLARRWIVVRHD